MAGNFNDAETISTITLNAVRIAVVNSFGEFSLRNMTVDSYHEAISRGFVWALSTYVMTESLKEKTETVEFSYPASWWDHFKAECFPEWLKRRYPPRLKTEFRSVHFEAREIYPMFPDIDPNAARGHRTVIEVRKHGRSRYDEPDDD